MAMAETVQVKHIDLITKEIKSMRGWLEFLERHVAAVEKEGGVIPAITLTSINESSNKIVYNAAIINGAALGIVPQGDAELPFALPVRIEGWHKSLSCGGWYLKDANDRIIFEVAFDADEETTGRPINGGNPTARAVVESINRAASTTAPDGEREFDAWWDEYQRPWLPNGVSGYEHAKRAWLAAQATTPPPAAISTLPNAPEVDPNRKCWASTTGEVCMDPRGCDDRGCQLYAGKDYEDRHAPTNKELRDELIATHATGKSRAGTATEAGEQERCGYCFAPVRAAAEEIMDHFLTVEIDELPKSSEVRAILSRWFGKGETDGLQRRLYDECVVANWDPERRNTFAEEIAHLHEELSEAFRAWRKYKDCEVREVNGKLEGVPIEFADALIGMFYNAELHGFDLLAAIERKHQFNLSRNYVAEGRQLHPPVAAPAAPSLGESSDKCEHGISLDEECLACENERDEVDVGSAAPRTSVEGESE